MKIGIQLPEVEREVRWPEYLAMAKAAEEVGFESVWLGDHLLYDGPERAPWEAWTLLSALAAATHTVRLGPLVACAGFHPPAVLAKMASTIDEVSGGRFVLGLGSGWNRREFDAGWLVPGWPPELGGRNAGPAETMIYFEELSRREIPRTRNPQGLGIIAPSLDSPRCGTLGFAVDYSSSITQNNVDQFCSELEEARASLNPERVVVTVFTTHVCEVLKFESGEPIVLPPVRSGGGTSFVGPVEYFDQSEERIEVLVFLTDLDCASFAPEPTYPVVWVSTRKGVAPYGDVILMY